MINAVHCYDPELIVLGGGIAEGVSTYIPEFQAAVDQHCWTPPGVVKITKSALESYAGAIGAACLDRTTSRRTSSNAS